MVLTAFFTLLSMKLRLLKQQNHLLLQFSFHSVNSMQISTVSPRRLLCVLNCCLSNETAYLGLRYKKKTAGIAQSV